MVRRHPHLAVYVHEKGAPHLVDPAGCWRAPPGSTGIRWTGSGGSSRRYLPRTCAASPTATSSHLATPCSTSPARGGTRTTTSATGTADRASSTQATPPELDSVRVPTCCRPRRRRTSMCRPGRPAWPGSVRGNRLGIFVTHFGLFLDADAHLEASSKELDAWVGLAREILRSEGDDEARRDRFVAAVRAQIEARVGPEEAGRYLGWISLGHFWNGLVRYLKRPPRTHGPGPRTVIRRRRRGPETSRHWRALTCRTTRNSGVLSRARLRPLRRQAPGGPGPVRLQGPGHARRLPRHDGERQDPGCAWRSSRRQPSTASRSSLSTRKATWGTCSWRFPVSPRRISGRGSTRTTPGARESAWISTRPIRPARWKSGLAEWGEDGARIARSGPRRTSRSTRRGAARRLPISILRSLDAPPAVLRDDRELFAERVTTTATSLLTLAGVDAEPVRSREHILVSTILSAAWVAGSGLDLPG